jgi:hypothetical protein
MVYPPSDNCDSISFFKDMDIADEVFQSITDPESEDMAVSFSIGLPPLLLRSGGNTYTYVGISLGCMAASAS